MVSKEPTVISEINVAKDDRPFLFVFISGIPLRFVCTATKERLYVIDVLCCHYLT